MRDIGKNIKWLRERRGMTQEEFAQSLFVTRQTVSNYETGRTRPDIDMLLRIAQTLNADVNDVLYGPPPETGRKAARRRMAVGCAALVLMALLFAVLTPAAEAAAKRAIFVPFILMVVVLRPGIFLLLGWCLMNGAGMFLSAKPLNRPWVRPARHVLLAALGLCGAVLLPYVLYGCLALVQYASGSWELGWFPQLQDVPVYGKLLGGLLLFNIRCPVLYTVPGAALWLLKAPPAQRQRTEQPAGESGE